MTLVEKKMQALGLKGKIMYMSRTQLREAREKYPAAKIVRTAVENPIISGHHAYIVENWQEVAKMPNNAQVIEMHLVQYLHETGQTGTLYWDAVLAYCIGYYETITMDHVVAIRELERTGLILGGANNA